MTLDRISGITLLVIGVVVFLKSLTYPLGSFQKPGGGLFPLIGSIVLMGLSILLIVQASASKEGKKTSVVHFFTAKEGPKRILFGLGALVAYRYLLPVIGFAFSTSLFIFILSKFLGKYGWKTSIFFSIVTGLTAYYLFQVWLKIPMPIPLLRF